MPTNYNHTIDGWFALEAYERYDMLPSEFDGPNELRQAFLENVGDDLESHRSTGANPTQAYNRATDAWPREARALLAAYEARYSQHDDEEYLEDCEEYAEEVGVDDYSEEGEPWSWDPDEYRSWREVVAAVLDAEGEDASFCIESSSYSRFINNLSEHESAHQAVSAELYSNDIPAGILSSLAPPDEWDEVDPRSPPIESCASCGNTGYRVHRVDFDDAVWVDHYGTVTNFHSPGDEYFILPSGNDDISLCDSCQNNSGGANRYIITSEEGAHGIRVSWPLAVDMAEESNGFEPVDEVFDELQDFARGMEAPGESTADRFGQIDIMNHPDVNNPSDVRGRQASFAEEMMVNPERLPRIEGIYISERGFTVFVDETSFEAVAALKGAMEEHLLA